MAVDRASILAAFARHRGLSVVLAILALPIVLIRPMSPAALDVLLTLNLTLSVIVLLTTLFVHRPLEFSVFPSLLLVTTLYRLVLNVASTRLILAEGEAGAVIATFGDTVAGNEVVVGFVVFIILIVIQFVVITKGATRISEVAARFTLDGMPGKQMAIDADLNAGLITEAQARDRRTQIGREADFYGAMDGASKFVRGDAVAGLLITVINIVGGLLIGVLQEGMTLAEAGRLYTILTIGDGLVTQIPAFLISIAAGLLVTRSASESDLGQELIGQIFLQPRTMGIAAGFLGAMIFLPGFPKWVLLGVGGGCGAVAWGLRSHTRRVAGETQETERRKAAKAPAKMEALLHVDTMEVEVGYGLIRLVDAAQGGSLLDRIAMIRRQVALDLGVIVPPVRIRDNMQLDANEYVIKIKGVRVAGGTIHPEQALAMDAGGARGEIEGIKTVEPAFGLPAVWVSATQRARAEEMGYTVVEAAAVLATHLTEVIKSHAADLLTRQEVTHLLETLKERSPKLVEEVMEKQVVRTADLQKVLQGLLREGVSIRDLETILEVLGDVGARVKDSETLVEYVRYALARSIGRKVQSDDGKLHAVALDPKLDAALMKSLERTESGAYLTLSPATIRRLIEAVSREVERLVVAGHPPVLLCAPQVRAPLKKITDSASLGLNVLSYNDVPREIPLETHGVVSLPEGLEAPVSVKA